MMLMKPTSFFQSGTHHVSPLLRLSPWLAVVCAVLLAGFVLMVGLRGVRHEGELTRRLMEEKGASLIGTLEGALRTGMGFQWTDEELRDILEKTGDQPDILHIVITDAQGRVLAASRDELTGTDYLSSEAWVRLAPSSTPRSEVLRQGGEESFQVYRMLEVSRFDERMEHYGRGRGQGHGMGKSWRRQRVLEAERKYTGQPIYVFAAYGMEHLRKAQAADTLHLYAVTTVAVFLVIVVGLFFLLTRSYRKSRQKMQEQLRHSERLAALGGMAAGIAHEIRNPLGAIKGLARFFQEASPPDSEAQRVAGIMTSEVARLDKVVSDMLDFARPDNLRLEPVPLDTLVQRMEHLLQPELEAQGVIFSARLPTPTPVLIMDADRMTQVLLNLGCNSLQAMPHGGRLEWICTREADTWVLEVRDNGPGMSEDVRQQAFSPYFTTRAEGTGLGLSIVHKIIEAHGGRVEILSAPGQGTKVRLLLPRDTGVI